MEQAIKIDMSGNRTPITARDASPLRTRGMSFLCVYCDKKVLLYQFDNGPEFRHNVQNKKCTYPRRKRAAPKAVQAPRRHVHMLRPRKRARY